MLNILQTLYKTQAAELREEVEDKGKGAAELEEERGSLAHQLQIALARADSEALARSIAEETIIDLEKEKTMRELELRDSQNRHRNDLDSKEFTLNNVSFKRIFLNFLLISFSLHVQSFDWLTAVCHASFL